MLHKVCLKRWSEEEKCLFTSWSVKQVDFHYKFENWQSDTTELNTRADKFVGHLTIKQTITHIHINCIWNTKVWFNSEWKNLQYISSCLNHIQLNVTSGVSWRFEVDMSLLLSWVGIHDNWVIQWSLQNMLLLCPSSAMVA